MEAKIYNQKGEETGKIKLPEAVFGVSWNSDLVHQVVFSILANKRAPFAHTKGRSEKRGGGRKPWRQKGTGRARHGSIRSPLWKGGGVTFGPSKERDFSKKINKKMKKKAFFSALSKKFEEGEVLFIDNIKIDSPKTSEAREILLSLSKIKGHEDILEKKNNSALIAFNKVTEGAKKSFNNFSNIEIDELKNLNAARVANFKYLVIVNPEESLKSYEKKAGAKKTTKVTKTKTKSKNKTKNKAKKTSKKGSKKAKSESKMNKKSKSKK